MKNGETLKCGKRKQSQNSYKHVMRSGIIKQEQTVSKNHTFDRVGFEGMSFGRRRETVSKKCLRNDLLK